MDKSLSGVSASSPNLVCCRFELSIRARRMPTPIHPAPFFAREELAARSYFRFSSITQISLSREPMVT